MDDKTAHMTEATELISLLGGFGSQKMQQIGTLPFLLVLFISLCASLFITFLYTRFYSSRSSGSSVYRAFPLLGISVTAIFICIQFSLPLSLGLLGALSIVRFRTPIKEPEEIGFILLIISTSICCATFNLLFLVAILAISVLALLITSFSRRLLKKRYNDGMIIIAIPQNKSDKQDKLIHILNEQITKGRLDSITHVENHINVSYSFIKLTEATSIKIKKDIKALLPEVQFNIYFNRQGQI